MECKNGTENKTIRSPYIYDIWCFNNHNIADHLARTDTVVTCIKRVYIITFIFKYSTILAYIILLWTNGEASEILICASFTLNTCRHCPLKLLFRYNSFISTGRNYCVVRRIWGCPGYNFRLRGQVRKSFTMLVYNEMKLCNVAIIY